MSIEKGSQTFATKPPGSPSCGFCGHLAAFAGDRHIIELRGVSQRELLMNGDVWTASNSTSTL